MPFANSNTCSSRIRGHLLSLLLLPPLGALSAYVSAKETDRQQIAAPQYAEGTKEGAKDVVIVGVPLFSDRLLSEFYADRDHQDFWDEGRARQMLELARQSREDGFDPEDFHATEIQRLIDDGQLKSTSAARRTAADILLSDALLRYLHQLRFGKSVPGTSVLRRFADVWR